MVLKYKKTALFLLVLGLGYVAICILTGGFKFYTGHRFVGNLDTIAVNGPCCPRIGAEWRKYEIPLLPIAFHIIYYPVTTNIWIGQLEFIDGKGFVERGDRLAILRREYSSFTIDSLRLVYDDQTSVTLIDTSQPVVDRTYKTADDPWDHKVAVFKKAVRKKQNIHIFYHGYATKKTGEKVPFSCCDKEMIEKVNEFWLRYEEWAGT